jgi:tetratricopeptide (TPR) repeat protein
VISTAMAKRMLTKVADAGAGDGVGLGVFLEKHGDGVYFGHDGSNEGFQARVLAHKDKGYGAALMANSDNGVALMNEVMDAIGAEYGWDGFGGAPLAVAHVDPARLAALAGAYAMNKDRIWRFEVTKDGLLLKTPFTGPAELVPVSDAVFVRKDNHTRYTFAPTADGGVELRTEPADGVAPVAKRVPDSTTVPLDDLAAGGVNKAAERYRAAIAADPDDPAYSHARLDAIGHDRMAEGRFDEALLLFRVNVLVHPDATFAHESLAEAYLRGHDRARAIASLRRAIAAAPKDKSLSPGTREAITKSALARLRDLRASP